MKPKLKIRIDPEKFKQVGISLVFHVDVLDAKGCICASEAIPMRQDFYHSLKQSAGWPESFFKIIRTRVADRLAEKQNPAGVGIDEILHLSEGTHEL